jgi:stage II sporulation protein D
MPVRAPDSTVRVLRNDGAVHTLSLEKYVRGAVEAETWVRRAESSSIAERVFEVQAIVSRTYAMARGGRHGSAGADVCDTTHCQLYREPAASHPWAELLDAAVARTSGVIIAYAGAPIEALFHADCGGSTTRADLVWGGDARPYHSSVTDRACATRPSGPWTVTVGRATLVRVLDADPRTSVGGQLAAIQVVSRDASGRAALVALTGRTSPVVRGEELRLVLTRGLGPRSVRSARFDVRREGDRFVFAGTGFGHGAGLCQGGALARLRAGAAPAEVLARYYPGTRLAALDRGRTAARDVRPAESSAHSGRRD